MKLEGLTQVPLDEQLIAPALARWSGNQEHPGHPVGIWGASSLSSCAHALGYRYNNVEPTNPMSEAGLHSTALGTLVHRAIQEELVDNPPKADGVELSVEAEKPWRLTYGDHVIIESWADLELSFGSFSEVSDIKTTAPFGFRMKSTREGPDRGQILQVTAAARALRAKRCRLVLISPAELKGADRIDKNGDEFDFRANRYTEWVWQPEVAAELLDEELNRLEYIGRLLADGREVPRHIPGVMPKGARIVDPETGVWQLWVHSDDEGDQLLDTGSVWQCRYCAWQDLCRSELAD